MDRGRRGGPLREGRGIFPIRNVFSDRTFVRSHCFDFLFQESGKSFLENKDIGVNGLFRAEFERNIISLSYAQRKQLLLLVSSISTRRAKCLKWPWEHLQHYTLFLNSS
jgi:hypothetical protein